MSGNGMQTPEDVYRFVAEGDTDEQIEYARRLAEGLERTGAARELTVEAMITQLACAGSGVARGVRCGADRRQAVLGEG